MQLNPLKAANRAIERMVQRRVKRQPGPVRIPRKRIYILPTRLGMGFALLVLVMVLGAMNYSNSLSFALAFLLAGIGLIGMHHTHSNLLNVEVAPQRSEAVFAGTDAQFGVRLGNPTAKPKFSLSIALAQADAPNAWADAPAGDGGDLSLTVPATQRGWLEAPRFTVDTRFPLGLFHAWTWLELDNRVLVYPQPWPDPVALPFSGDEGDVEQAASAGDDDFSGVREYQRGDSRAAIHWKSAAKLGPDHEQLVAKQFSRSQSPERALDFDRLASTDIEVRLSQLCRAVIDAHSAGDAFSLRLPGMNIEASTGDAHQARCLAALALFQRPGATS